MKDINLLHPKLRILARKLLEKAEQEGIHLIITSTLRTPKEQDELYAQGRQGEKKNWKVVTNVPYPWSMHNWGLAFDVCVVKNIDGQMKADWNSKEYKRVGEIGKSLGLNWGGDWKEFVDLGHFELPGYRVANLIAVYKTPDKFLQTFNQFQTDPEVENLSANEIPGEPVTVQFGSSKIKGYLVNNRVYAPVRDIVSILGKEVEWNQDTRTAIIK